MMIYINQKCFFVYIVDRLQMKIENMTDGY